jgi:hypothetical protein
MTQRLDPRSDRPLALQLADVLRAEIQDLHRPGRENLPAVDVRHPDLPQLRAGP